MAIAALIALRSGGLSGLGIAGILGGAAAVKTAVSLPVVALRRLGAHLARLS
jgi:hypothetical protein